MSGTASSHNSPPLEHVKPGSLVPALLLSTPAVASSEGPAPGARGPTRGWGAPAALAPTH
eukprot:8381572-Alexandrium_andersonii.AAC.1